MKKILISFSIVLIGLFSGCGGGSTSSSSGGGDTSTNMVENRAYTMSTSGVITKTSSDADVTVTTNLEQNTTTATLTSGTATCVGCTVVPLS